MVESKKQPTQASMERGKAGSKEGKAQGSEKEGSLPGSKCGDLSEHQIDDLLREDGLEKNLGQF